MKLNQSLLLKLKEKNISIDVDKMISKEKLKTEVKEKPTEAKEKPNKS